MPYECKVCGGGGEAARHVAREMMFGLREPFEYFECPRCGSLQIAAVPADLARFYPKTYYSLAEQPRTSNWLALRLKRARARYCMSGRGMLGRLIAKRTGCPPYLEWFRRAGVSFSDAILEIGSGNGDFLNSIATDGFLNPLGVDPFVDTDLSYPSGARVYRRAVEQLTGQFDLVLSQHSIEHVPEPTRLLRHVATLLRPDKTFIVRTPVAGSFAWRTYGTDWVHLDAPRHLVIFSVAGMRLAARRSGFELADVQFDSNDFSFTGSEQYRRDVPLADPRSHWRGKSGHIFSPQEMEAYARRAQEVNAVGDGDSAIFYLRRTG